MLLLMRLGHPQVLENSVLAALATLLKVLLVPVQLLAIVAKRAGR